MEDLGIRSNVWTSLRPAIPLPFTSVKQKLMFSEFNEQRVATSLEHKVVQALGFELAEEKLHVSVHLNDYGRPGGAPAGVVVSLVVADKEARACTVRKIKSSTAKVRGGVAQACTVRKIKSSTAKVRGGVRCGGAIGGAGVGECQ